MAYHYFLSFLQYCAMPAELDDIDKKLKLAIATRMKEIRVNLGKTQKDLAYEAGRDKQSLNKNEKGKGTTIYVINKFCVDMKITLSEFFDDPIFYTPKNK